MQPLAMLRGLQRGYRRRRDEIVSRAPVQWQATRQQLATIPNKAERPVVVIGAGLGGLATAGFLSRAGFPVTVLEQHSLPGGYATVFSRPPFDFEVSLHVIPVHGNGNEQILRELGVLDRVRFHSLPEQHRLITPDLDLTLPSANPEAYVHTLAERFAGEAESIRGFVQLMVDMAKDVEKLSDGLGLLPLPLFPLAFPRMWKWRRSTFAEMLEGFIDDPRLRRALSATWPYYGLPPSECSGFIFAVATGDQLRSGGHYPEGGSQAISDALVATIRDGGGEVRLKRRVERIECAGGAASVVHDHEGNRHDARIVIFNGGHHALPELVGSEIDANSLGAPARKGTPSLSSFVAWFGLDRPLRDLIPNAEIFLTTGHDPEADYRACLAADANRAPLVVSVPENISPTLVPQGKGILSAVFLCGYGPWRRFEQEYGAGRNNRPAYEAFKQQTLDRVIDRLEARLVPGLRDMIAVAEASTPLTNRRYTGNTNGAIYGHDFRINNAYMTRVTPRTALPNLYITGAWSMPGGGFTGVLRGAQQTVRCVAEDLGV